MQGQIVIASKQPVYREWLVFLPSQDHWSDLTVYTLDAIVVNPKPKVKHLCESSPCTHAVCINSSLALDVCPLWARCWCAIRKMSVMALVQRLVTGERWNYIIICLCLEVYASPLAVVCVGFIDEWGFLSCHMGQLREVLHQVLYSRVNSKCQWSP